MSIGGVGYTGIQQGMARLNYHANRIAHYGTQAGSQDVSGVAEDMVGLKQSEFQVKASAEVLRTEFRTIGSLLDVRA